METKVAMRWMGWGIQWKFLLCYPWGLVTAMDGWMDGEICGWSGVGYAFGVCGV